MEEKRGKKGWPGEKEEQLKREEERKKEKTGRRDRNVEQYFQI